jgi:hypothetical protein
MTPYPSFFSHTSSTRHAPTIHIANGSTMFVRSIDTISTFKLSISNVFHVPQLSYNLLFVGQLAELGYRIILRALLLSSKVPVPFWGEVVLTVTHAINHIPNPTIYNQTPYERIFGSPPHYQHL